MQPIVFNRSGKFRLTKYDGCGKLKNGEKSSFRHGAVMRATPSISFSTTNIESGNSNFPSQIRVTGTTGTVAVELSYYPPDLHAFVLGNETVKETDVLVRAIDVERTIDDATYTVTLEHPVSVSGYVEVVGIDNNSYTEVSGSPALGQFSVSADTLTFSSADAGKPVFITHDYSVDTAYVKEQGKNDAPAVMQLEIDTDSTVEMGGQMYDVYMVWDKVMLQDGLTPPPIDKAPGTHTLTFGILEPRGGKPMVKEVYVPRGESCV